MANPVVYGGQQPNAATQPVAGVNNLSPAVVRNRNDFYSPYQFLNTERFAEITPFLIKECGFNEDLRYHRNTDLRCPTFASPIMSQIIKHAHYVAVPKSVLYPENWEYMTVIPKKGSDIDFTKVRIGVNPSDFLNDLDTFFTFLKECNLTSDNPSCFPVVLSLMVFLYYGFGPDSLFSLMDCNPFSSVKNGSDIRSVLFTNLFASQSDSDSEVIVTLGSSSSLSTSYTLVSGGVVDMDAVRHVCEWCSIRDLDIFLDSSDADYYTKFSVSGSAGNLLVDINELSSQLEAVKSNFVNFERVVAYQLACAHFFTSDDVDYIYTARLYYSNLSGIVNDVMGHVASHYEYPGFPTFVYNGDRFYYDIFSSEVIHTLLDSTRYFSTTDYNYFFEVLSYLNELVVPRHSLRYGDYFNACRIQPLAVGDYSAPVVSNSVSAVDMTTATLMQRLLNNVNSVRNTIQSYIKMLYGVVPENIPMQPLYFAHSSDVLAGNLVSNNTSEEQGALVTNIQLHSSHNEFDVHFNQDCIVLGLTTYDILPCYVDILDPFSQKCERLDYFNPLLQNIGDQPVKAVTLFGAASLSETIWGYLQNDAEYKQSISVAHGAFAHGNIPSWAFIRDMQAWLKRDGHSNICPAFIRHENYEFDQFFSVLQGQLVDYYHFIVSYVHEFNRVMPAEYVSGVLFENSKM